MLRPAPRRVGQTEDRLEGQRVDQMEDRKAVRLEGQRVDQTEDQWEGLMEAL